LGLLSSLRLKRPAAGAASQAFSRTASALVAALPAYQVAFWPDGWEVGASGEVRVRDTHAMAEARRWYALADRAPGRPHMDRTMRLYGTFVPRSIVALAGRRFASESVASVAVQLVAGDWIVQRRRELMAAPEEAIRMRGLGWTGSRHDSDLDDEGLAIQVAEVVAHCMREGLIPASSYELKVRPDDGFGIRGYRCLIGVAPDGDLCARYREAIQTALVPWNRAVVRDGSAHPLVKVEVRRRAARVTGRSG
jgi:hypothetical protein